MKVPNKLLPILICLMAISLTYPLQGNLPNSADGNEREIHKLQQDLLKAEIAMLAATKLLEMKDKKAFGVVEKSLASSSAKIQIQIIRALRFKKDNRALNLLMPYFSNSQTDPAVREEIGKTLKIFGSHKEVLEYFLSLITSPSGGYAMAIRKQALESLKKMLHTLPPAEALSYYHRILQNNGQKQDVLNQKAFREIEKITGKGFHSFQKWDKWWALNKEKSQLEWFQDVKKNLRDKLKKSEENVFFWWKKYIESIESSDPTLHLKGLIESLERNDHPLQTRYSLNKIQNFPNLDKETRKKIIDVLINLLEQENNPSGLRIQAVQTLGKISLGAPSPQIEKSAELLVKIFQNSQDIPLRIQACNALASLKSRQALPIFLKSLSDPKEILDVVQEVIRNLSPFQDTKDNSILKAVLLRLEITYGNKSPLSDKVNHSELLSLSIEKLGHFHYHDPGVFKKSTTLLHNLLRHKSMKIRYFASNSLGKIGDTNSLPPLVQSLKDSDQSVQKTILGALISILKRTGESFKEEDRKNMIDAVLSCYKSPKLRKRTAQTLITLVGNSLELLNHSVEKLNGMAREVGKGLNSYGELMVDLLEKILPEKPTREITENPRRELLYWTLRETLARTYLQQQKAEKALPHYQAIPQPSLVCGLETIETLFLIGKFQEGEVYLEKILQKLTSQNFSTGSSHLLEILKITFEKNPSLAEKLLQKWEKSPLWQGKAREKLLQFKKKLSPKSPMPKKDGTKTSIILPGQSFCKAVLKSSLAFPMH